jgi:RNA polymerase sigma factor (TIGR02999 family)
MDDAPGPITILIRRVQDGDDEARTELWNTFFPILRQKANVMMAGNNVGAVVRPSDILQGAFVQLLAREKLGWNDSKHLLAFAVTVMRNLITDHARRRLRKDRVFIPVDESLGLVFKDDVSWVQVNEILNQLEKIDPVKAKVVELRAYGGLTNEEIANHLGISLSTVKRHLEFARGFIMSRLQSSHEEKERDES